MNQLLLFACPASTHLLPVFPLGVTLPPVSVRAVQWEPTLTLGCRVNRILLPLDMVINSTQKFYDQTWPNKSWSASSRSVQEFGEVEFAFSWG